MIPAARQKGLKDKIRCMLRAGCPADACDDSNYCDAHRPRLFVENKEGIGISLKAQIAIAVVGCSLFLWVLPAITAHIQSRIEPETKTFVLAVRCRVPDQHEQVTILVRDAGAPLQRGECVYVRARGAYGATK